VVPDRERLGNEIFRAVSRRMSAESFASDHALSKVPSTKDVVGFAPADSREKSIQDIERQKRGYSHVGQIDDLTDTKVDGDARQNVSLFSRKAIFLRQ
jgi:hypothetical protein